MTGSSPRRAARGFTLIELLVVMLIIGTLLSIAVPRYFRTLAHARETVLRQDLAILRESIDKYYADRGEYPDTLVALVGERHERDRKSTRLNSSHSQISYAVFCLKNKK